jgi:hypothetical protein
MGWGGGNKRDSGKGPEEEVEGVEEVALKALARRRGVPACINNGKAKQPLA